MKTKETSKATAQNINEKLQPTKSAQISKLEEASNLKKTTAKSVDDNNGGLSVMQLKSMTNNYLKREHNSLNSVLRTIRENFNAPILQDYLKALEANNLNITINDFEYNEVIKMLLYYTDEKGIKVYSRLSKITDRLQPVKTLGNYSVTSGETIESKETDIIFNGTHTLKAINGFSMWFILTLVVKVAKIEATTKKRAIRLFNRELSDYAKNNGLKIKESQNYCAENSISNIDIFMDALKNKKVFESLKFEKKAKKESK